MKSIFQKIFSLSLLYLVFGVISITAATHNITLQQYETIQQTIPNSENKNLTLSSGSLPSGLTLQITSQTVSTLTGSGTTDSVVAVPATFNTPHGIVRDSSGNIYLTDTANNKIRKITPAGIVSTFAGSGETGSSDGNSTSASFDAPTGITIDTNGNLFVTDTGNNLIRKITPTGVVTTIAGSGEAGSDNNSTGVNATFNAPMGIINVNGTLYIADSGNHKIRKITSAGVVSTFAGSGEVGNDNGNGAIASFYSPSAITVDKNGILYVADTGNGLIRKITSAGVVSTIAGIDDGNSITFSSPSGITVDGNLNIYITDTDNNLIKKITQNSTGTIFTTSFFAGNGEAGNSDSSSETNASFHTPIGIFIDNAGYLYIADSLNNTIRKITPAGDVSTIAGSGVAGDTNGMAIVVTPAIDTSNFLSPNGVVVDSSGNIFIADTSHNVIKKIGIDGISVVFAGSGETGSSDGNSTSALFNAPSGIAIDKNGNIYVADTSNNQIRKITSTGIVSTLAGKPITYDTDGLPSNSGSTDANGTSASFFKPKGITIDNNGTNLYVADTFNNKIRRIIIATKVVSTIAGKPITYATDGSPSDNSGSTDANGTTASFFSPSGIAINSANDTLYVTDSDNHLIRKITISSKSVSTLAGSGDIGDTNGTGTVASFSTPTGVAVDSDGNILVADSGNNKIRKITPAGVVSTFAGNGDANLTDGELLTASFSSPSGIATTSTGYVYVADSINNKIRKIAPPHWEIAGSIATAGTYSFTLAISGGENETYNITVEPKCSSSQKEVGGVCIAKTCQTDGFECPSCDESYQTLAYNTNGSGYCATNTYTVSYLPSNATMGDITSNQSGNSLAWGTIVTLTATPKTGYKFVSWSDGSASPERNETIYDNLTLTASFQAMTCQDDFVGCPQACTSYQTLQYNQNGSGYCKNNSFSVSYASNDLNMGSVTSSETENSLEWGTPITLIAQPKEGFKFVSWSDGSTTNPKNLTITQAINLTATFIAQTCSTDGYKCVQCTQNQHLIYTTDSSYCATDKYTISFSTSQIQGNITLQDTSSYYDSGEGSFNWGKQLTLTAIPTTGYKFVKWSDDNTTNPRTIIMNENKIFSAYFQAKTCRDDKGDLCPSCATYQTLNYNDNGSGYCSTNSYNISYLSLDSTMGNVSSNQSGNSLEWGTTFTLTATPLTGFKFVKWSDNNTTNPRVVTVNQAIDLNATFIAQTCQTDGYDCPSCKSYETLGYNENGSGYCSNNSYSFAISSNDTSKGTVSKDLNGTTFGYGSIVKITALPITGYKFEKWSDNNTTNPRDITIKDNTTLSANFIAKTCEADNYLCPTTQLALKGDWNLVALPIDITLNDISNKFGNDVVIWTYNKDNNSKPWSVYANGITIPTTVNSLLTIKSGEGFWVKIPSDVNRTIVFDSNVTYDVTTKLHLNSLSSGWYLLGTGINKTVNELKGSNKNISLLWKYLNGSWQTSYDGTLPNNVTKMDDIKAGEGFWISVK